MANLLSDMATNDRRYVDLTGDVFKLLTGVLEALHGPEASFASSAQVGALQVLLDLLTK
jgi:hypothetical protein